MIYLRIITYALEYVSDEELESEIVTYLTDNLRTKVKEGTAEEAELKKRLCSFARRRRHDCVIAVESEETDRCDIRNPSLHSCYGR